VDINLTTPSLLFPAISLLLLAFTNRFLALAALIRSLNERYQNSPDEHIVEQLGNLRYRVTLIRYMQEFGVLSLLLCVACMFALFAGQVLPGKVLFGVSLVSMMVSLALSIREIHVSINALDVQLSEFRESLHATSRK
jgi:hypothetical protein